MHVGDLIPGKVLRSHKTLYVAYGGEEKPYSDYEILVSDIQNDLKWIRESDGKTHRTIVANITLLIIKCQAVKSSLRI